jgi:hypothetical protein
LFRRDAAQKKQAAPSPGADAAQPAAAAPSQRAIAATQAPTAGATAAAFGLGFDMPGLEPTTVLAQVTGPAGIYLVFETDR